MDLCAKRYASPFELLNMLIEQHTLSDFILDLNRIKTEEQVWDVWLYKVTDKNFNDFRRSVLPRSPSSSGNSKADIEIAIESSRSALEQFKGDNL